MLLILLTAASVVALRDWLLIEELGTRPYVGVAGNHLTILLNLRAFLRNLVSLKLYVDAWVLLILAYGLALLRWGARTADARRLAQGLFALGLLAAIFAFGVINETRMFLMFVPLLVFSAADAWLERRSAGAAVRQS